MAAPTYTFKAFQADYPSDDACLIKLMEVQHGGTETLCPGCNKQARFHLMRKRKAFACQLCGHHIYPCAGTIFNKSRTKLTHWFFAMYLMTTTRHGVPAKEVQRQTGVTYKTAWRMCHELRKQMAEADRSGPLGGHIEIDDAYVGGVRKNQPRKKGRGTDKPLLMGMVERGGRVKVRVMPNLRSGIVEHIVKTNVVPGSRLSTDELRVYRRLRKKGFKHTSVKHGRGEYVRGDVHTNSIEGFWSRLKLSIRGTHVHVSKRHLWKYAAEFSYRYNMRKQPQEIFHKLISSVSRLS